MTLEWVGTLSKGTYQLGLQNTQQQKLVVKGKCHQQVASVIPCTAVASKGAAADSGGGSVPAMMWRRQYLVNGNGRRQRGPLRDVMEPLPASVATNIQPSNDQTFNRSTTSGCRTATLVQRLAR